jgi:flagellar FliJ protein
MTRFPLQTLLDLSELRLDEAARKLGELIAGENQAAERLTILIQYREEYHARFLTAARNGLGRSAWHNYQSFILRLDDAIVQAREQVETSKVRTAAGKDEWLDKRGRLKAFDTLSDRHEDRERRIDARQEQKLLDEHSARLLGRKDNE